MKKKLEQELKSIFEFYKEPDKLDELRQSFEEYEEIVYKMRGLGLISENVYGQCQEVLFIYRGKLIKMLGN